MATMADLFIRGKEFAAATGLKSGAELEDLIARAYPVASSQLVDQATIETFSDAAVCDDDGNPINRLRVKDGGITVAKLQAKARVAATAADRLALHAYTDTAIALPGSATTNLILEHELRDSGSCYNTTTGLFLPTTAGLYLVIGHVYTSGTNPDIQAIIRVNGGDASWGGVCNATHARATAVDIISMNGTSDTINLAAKNSSAAAAALSAGSGSFMTSLQAVLLCTLT